MKLNDRFERGEEKCSEGIRKITMLVFLELEGRSPQQCDEIAEKAAMICGKYILWELSGDRLGFGATGCGLADLTLRNKVIETLLRVIDGDL